MKNEINIPNLNKKEIRHSHILKTTNIFAKLLAIIFDIYPHSIIPAFSNILLKDNADKCRVNPDLLALQLNEAEVSAYIKFMVFKRDGLSFSGHSMVIKKISDNQYSFFDPNLGEYQGLNMHALEGKINKAITSYGGGRVAFIDGQKYIADLGISTQASKEDEKDGVKANKQRI